MNDFQERKEKLVHKTFKLMLVIAVIFALPAFTAFFLGKYLDSFYGSSNKFILISLAIAFVFSWVIVIFIYSKISGQFKKLNQEEKIAREKEAKEKINLKEKQTKAEEKKEFEEILNNLDKTE